MSLPITCLAWRYDNNKKFNECIINVFRNTINPGYLGMHYNQNDNKNKILLLLIL